MLIAKRGKREVSRFYKIPVVKKTCSIHQSFNRVTYWEANVTLLFAYST